MTPRASEISHPGRIQAILALAFAVMVAHLATPTPAAATLTSVTSMPVSPTTCDSVIVTVAGTTPTPCYEVYRMGMVEPIELPTMGPIPTFEVRVGVVLKETVASDSVACPAVIQPYERSFRLDHLRFGNYVVKVTEYIMRAGSDTREFSSELTGSFHVGYDETCLNFFDCYYLRFVGHLPGTRLGGMQRFGRTGRHRVRGCGARDGFHGRRSSDLRRVRVARAPRWRRARRLGGAHRQSGRIPGGLVHGGIPHQNSALLRPGGLDPARR